MDLSESWFLFVVVLMTTCCGSLSDGRAIKNNTTTATTTQPRVNNTAITFVKSNKTDTTPAAMITNPSGKISGMALRAFYVIIAVSSIVIVYFVVRSVCSRKRRQNTRRYGVLRGDKRDQMEMHPLSEVEDDDDEDDLTLFDISDQKRNLRGKR